MKYIIGEGATALSYTITEYGKDILIHIDGGESHLGSISVAGNGIFNNVTFPGHMEHFLTEPLAKAIAATFRCNCCVTAGVHINEISKSEIDLILEQHNAFIPKLTEKIRRKDAQ